MPNANPYVLKKFFADFNRFYDKKGTKKLKGITESFFKRRGHLKVPARFTDKFYSDLMVHPDRNEYCIRISEFILNLIVGNKNIPTVPKPEDLDKKKKSEPKSPRQTLKEILNQTEAFLQSEDPPIPVDKQIFILTGLLFITRGDSVLYGPVDIFKAEYERPEDFIIAVTEKFFPAIYESRLNHNSDWLDDEEFDDLDDLDDFEDELNPEDLLGVSPSETAVDNKPLNGNAEDLSQNKETQAKDSEKEESSEIKTKTNAEIEQQSDLNVNPSPENTDKAVNGTIDGAKPLVDNIEAKVNNSAETSPVANIQSHYAAYPLDGEEDEEDPEQLENAKPARVYDSDYVTGQLKKTGYFWNFYPLYEWKDGQPSYIKDLRTRFGPFCNIALTNMEALLPADKKKLLRGAMYNIKIGPSDALLNSQNRCEIDAPSLFREKHIWRADKDKTDNGYRCAYYIVEPANPNGWSLDDPTIKVKMAGYQILPEDIEDLFKVPVLLNIGSSFIGPLKLMKDGQGQLVVSSRSTNHEEYVYDSFGESGEPLWPMDAIRYEEPLQAVFTYPLFTTRKEIDLITDSKLLKLASRIIPKERKYIEKLGEWVEELPSTEGKSELMLSRPRVRRLEDIISNNKRAGTVISSLVPSVAKLLESEIEGKAELVTAVAKAIAANPQATALLLPDPEFQKGLENLRNHKEELEKELDALKKSYNEEKIQLELKREHSQAAQEVSRLNAEIDALHKELDLVKAEKQKEEEELNKRKEFLADAETQLEGFEKRLDQTVDKVASLAFEGSLTAKIMAAADHWRAEKDDSTYRARVQALRELPKNNKCGKELNKYLCETLEGIRKYHPNEFVNLFVCLAQSFLTVLAGSPGSGKTSLCNYVARLFGLTTIKDQKGISDLWAEHSNYANRYIPISVERGWTSKRDLIGYFNPLSRTFESVDPHRFECFKQLDYEAKEHFEEMPYFLLLDEANLSPMEYYFADFMNICDIRNDLSFVSIGGDSRFQIPDSLRFLATVNNDHTTEMLSPRLVDRTWIIQLPEIDSVDVSPDKVDKQLDKCSIVDWNSFRTTYAAKQRINPQLQQDLKRISSVLSSIGMILSPRTRIAISNYVSTAQSFMTKEGTGRTPYKVALDFAIAQKILPMINGSGETYKAGLDMLKEFLAGENLTKSASALERVIIKGTDAMDFYRFF